MLPILSKMCPKIWFPHHRIFFLKNINSLYEKEYCVVERTFFCTLEIVLESIQKSKPNFVSSAKFKNELLLGKVKFKSTFLILTTSKDLYPKKYITQVITIFYNEIFKGKRLIFDPSTREWIKVEKFANQLFKSKVQCIL